VVCFFGFWFLVGFFGIGRGSNVEPFNPNKMSQVPKVWPRPAWAQAQEVKGLQNFERKLQDGLDSIPKDLENREWRYEPWHGSIPTRPAPAPFKFYSQWAAENCPPQ
jgi:hypothetical protein